jgi:hypothetical protein
MIKKRTISHMNIYIESTKKIHFKLLSIIIMQFDKYFNNHLFLVYPDQ